MSRSWSGPLWATVDAALYAGDARETLRGLASDSVDCVVTSPPYWGLRDYRVAGQYGVEPTLDRYLASLVAVFDQVGRVLRRDGTVWVNLGDTYGGSWGNYVARGSCARSAGQRVGWRQGSLRPPQTGARRKDLQGVPWRVAFALVARGWVLREAIVWVKPQARPESVTDRCAQRYEMVFCLTRDHGPQISLSEGGVWSVAAGRSTCGHVAVGSVDLARCCVRAGCRSGGVVLDPFCGSGTTGVAAWAQGCSFLGIDLDPASLVMARRRLAGAREGLS